MATSFHRIAYEALDICNGVRLADVVARLADVPLSGDSRVVDIGTGNGAVAMAMAALYPIRVDAIEADTDMAELARRRFASSPQARQLNLIVGRSGDVLDTLSPIDLMIALGTTDPAGLGRAPPEMTLTRLGQRLAAGGHLLWGDLTFAGEPPGPIRTFVEATNLYTDDAGWRAAAAAAGLKIKSGVRSGQDVWDDYVATMMTAVDSWLDQHGDDPDAGPVRTTAERLKMMFDIGRPWLGFNLYLMQRPATVA